MKKQPRLNSIEFEHFVKEIKILDTDIYSDSFEVDFKYDYNKVCIKITGEQYAKYLSELSIIDKYFNILNEILVQFETCYDTVDCNGNHKQVIEKIEVPLKEFRYNFSDLEIKQIIALSMIDVKANNLKKLV